MPTHLADTTLLPEDHGFDSVSDGGVLALLREGYTRRRSSPLAPTGLPWGSRDEFRDPPPDP